MNDNNNVLTIKTVQIAPFRTLMTALKDILLETNITFQKDGIRIINMDKSHTILAHLFLDAEKFEYYYCKFPKIIIGVNMFHLFKLINSIDNDDTLTIYIEESEYSEGVVDYLGLKFENGDTLLFGRESYGVPQNVHKIMKFRIKIPMIEKKRSLNLASSVAIILSENIRQTKYTLSLIHI